MNTPVSLSELRNCMLDEQAVPLGAGTKPGMLPAETKAFSMCHFTGILEYDPSEYTFTAKAGTPVAEIAAALAAHGQYLPFDPPFLEEGSTLGGMVAAGLNGPGAFRYGGLRDFILGVTFMTQDGRCLRGGGKVVKNAAGFDLPKFLVGSQGRWGVITEVTFKVFPKPPAALTLRLVGENVEEVLKRLAEGTRAPWEFDALEFDPDGDNLVARIRGHDEALETRFQRIQDSWPECQPMDKDQAAAFWREMKSFRWASGGTLIKLPCCPSQILALEETLRSIDVSRRYGLGGHVLWAAGRGSDLASLEGEFTCLRGDLTPGSPCAGYLENRLQACFQCASKVMQ